MKLGLSMLIIGVILAGIGVAAFIYADPNVSLWTGDVEEARILDAGGIGLAVIGFGLVIGGIVRMIVKRS